jgi:2-keto-3-deoxy-L-rhamnonate aldolase RhmA
MEPAMHSTTFFKQRVRRRERLAGTFVKTAAHPLVEVLGTTGLDFVVIDAEHAPLDRTSIDVCVLAARANALPALVRIPDDAPATILSVLDVGAAGLLVPHARSEAGVRDVIASARYRDGTRGFSNSPRAGRYGSLGMAELIERADAETTVVFQVEDRDAVENVERLAAIDAVDCLFIGRADLAVSYGAGDVNDAIVDRAVRRVCDACAAAQKAVGIFVADARDVERYARLGASLFVIGSDQSMLRAQASAVATAVRAA